MKPLVTVIIPNYNYAKYLKDCFTSILNQSYPHLEVLLVDDGSTDESLSVIDTFKGRVKVLSQVHQGVNTARNLGLKNAHGKYIAFCDSDDIWLPEKIELQVNFLEKNSGFGLVYSGIQVVTDDLKFIRNQDAKDSGDCSKEFLRRPSEAIVLLGASTALIRSDLINAVGGFDEAMNGPGEDWDFFRRVAEKTLIDYIPQHLVLYRQHEQSASRVSSIKYFEGNRRAVRNMFRQNPDLSFSKCRFIWINLHWGFAKTELKKLKLHSAVQELIKGFLKMGL